MYPYWCIRISHENSNKIRKRKSDGGVRGKTGYQYLSPAGRRTGSSAGFHSVTAGHWFCKSGLYFLCWPESPSRCTEKDEPSGRNDNQKRERCDHGNFWSDRFCWYLNFQWKLTLNRKWKLKRAENQWFFLIFCSYFFDAELPADEGQDYPGSIVDVSQLQCVVIFL